MAGKTAHFPKADCMVQNCQIYVYVYVLTISSNSICDGGCVCVCVALRDMRVIFFGLHHLTQTPFDSATHSHSLICLSLSFTCRHYANFPRSCVAMSPCTYIVRYYNCRYSRLPPRCVCAYRRAWTECVCVALKAQTNGLKMLTWPRRTGKSQVSPLTTVTQLHMVTGENFQFYVAWFARVCVPFGQNSYSLPTTEAWKRF